MDLRENSFISRRGLLRAGVLTGLTAIVPAIGGNSHAKATPTATPTPMPCNPDRPTTPAAALAALVAGNSRWMSGSQIHPGEDTTRRTCVATTPQTPFAAILSCSDSRVPPELIFDQGLGDLFVARVAGNSAGGRLTETLYYGQSTLGVPLLFVMGHSSCGAVSAAVDSFPRHSLAFVRFIFPAVQQARKIVRQNGGDPNDRNQVIPVATDQNVILVVNLLRKEFKDAINAGQLMVQGGRYDLSTQQVTILTQ
jgi:carbonic anhydrase